MARSTALITGASRGIGAATAAALARDGAAQVSAFGRIGTPKDVADIISFLASDRGRWVTGQTIDATGGSSL